MMPRAHRMMRAAAFVACIIAGMTIWRVSVQRGPLEGEFSHDLGVVRLEGGNRLVEHVFTLHNRSPQALEVLARSDCGCLTVPLERLQVEPGGMLELPATLTVKAGKRKEAIRLIVNGGNAGRLWLSATGRFVDLLAAVPDRLELSADDAVQLHGWVGLVADVYHTDEPPGEPRVTAPAGVNVRFGGWALSHRSTSNAITPSRWTGRLEIHCDQPLGAAQEITIALPSGGVSARVTISAEESEQAGMPPSEP